MIIFCSLKIIYGQKKISLKIPDEIYESLFLAYLKNKKISLNHNLFQRYVLNINSYNPELRNIQISTYFHLIPVI